MATAQLLSARGVKASLVVALVLVTLVAAKKDKGPAVDIQACVNLLLGSVQKGDLAGVLKGAEEVACLKGLIAKALGSAIILGSCILKVPQLLAVYNSQSAEGLALSSLYLELVALFGTIIYNLQHKASPLTTYGEALTILAQNLVLLCLMWRYGKTPVSQRVLAMLAIGAFAVTAWVLPTHRPEYVERLPMLNLPLTLLMRWPQVWTNYQNGHTGQLAFLTVFMSFGGAVARVFTTIQELGPQDPQVGGYALGASLSLLLLVQLGLYRKATVAHNTQAHKKKTK